MKSIWIGLFDAYDNELLEKSYKRVEVKSKDLAVITLNGKRAFRNKNKIDFGSSIDPWGVVYKAMLFENENTNTPLVEFSLTRPCPISSDTHVSIDVGKLVITTDINIFA